MKNITFFFLSENFKFLEEKFSIYLNRRVFVMLSFQYTKPDTCTNSVDETAHNEPSHQDIHCLLFCLIFDGHPIHKNRHI